LLFVFFGVVAAADAVIRTSAKKPNFDIILTKRFVDAAFTPTSSEQQTRSNFNINSFELGSGVKGEAEVFFLDPSMNK
jgi:hypothetical protein